MRAECAATWGAFCAMRNGILSDDFTGSNADTSLKESVSHDNAPPVKKEIILRKRYGNALRKIEHFFPIEYVPLLHWLREEGDIFNIKLLMKNILFRRDNHCAASLLLHKPAVRFSPPDPSDIKNFSDLLSHYSRSYAAYSLKKGNSLFEQNRDFFFFEAGCDFARIESLINIARLYPELEQSRIISSVSLMTATWKARLPLIRELNSNAADCITASLYYCKKNSEKTRQRIKGGKLLTRKQKDIFSPSWYFSELMLIHEKITRDSSFFYAGGYT